MLTFACSTILPPLQAGLADIAQRDPLHLRSAFQEVGLGGSLKVDCGQMACHIHSLKLPSLDIEQSGKKGETNLQIEESSRQ